MERSVEIIYYGMIAERLGIKRESLELPSGSLDLKSFLYEKHPQLKDFTFSLAVDLEYATSLEAEDQPKKIDVMPPFAGG